MNQNPSPGNERHRHPQNDKEWIFGRLLEDKEDLEEGDVSPDPNTKKWEKIPAVHVGARLPAGHKTMFVRPTKQPTPWWRRLRSTTATLLFLFFLTLAIYFVWMICTRVESAQETRWEMLGFVLSVLSAGIVPMGTTVAKKHER